MKLSTAILTALAGVVDSAVNGEQLCHCTALQVADE